MTAFHVTNITSSGQFNVLVLIKRKLYKDQTSDNTSKVIYLHTFKDSAFDSSPLNVHVTALTFTRPACHPVLDSTEKHGNMGM